MKYLVVSDNHGDREILVQLVEKYAAEMDGLFHCGDSELTETDELWEKFVVVQGNCDYGSEFPLSRTIQTQEDTIYITHGHLSNVRQSLHQLSMEAKEKKATIALFGHTHELGVEYKNGVLYLNPGSIRLPRGKYLIKTYAIIESTAQRFEIAYYDEKFQPIPELSFSFPK